MALNEATERVSQLENALKRLDFVKKHLNQNATDIKGEIHACVSRNLECLRGREVTLLSQVDKVLTVKEEALHQQEARLNQALGVLRTGLTLLIDDKTSELQLSDALEKLNSLELSPGETPHIAFRVDHVSLRESILNYGRVDANGLPLATAFDDPGNPSASLPRHIEEYEDADHHVFYKTVEEVKRANSTTSTITVNIPKLSTRIEDWLPKKYQAKQTGPSTPVAPSFPASLALRPSTLASLSSAMPGRHTGSSNSTPSDTCSLNNWLSIIKNSTDLEEEHDFEIIDNSQVRSYKAKTAESNDLSQKKNGKDFFQHIKKNPELWLNAQSLKQLDDAAGKQAIGQDFFQHIPKKTEAWLITAYKQLQSLEEMKYVDCFKHISREPSHWLRRPHHGEQKPKQCHGASGTAMNVQEPGQTEQHKRMNCNNSSKIGNRIPDQDKWLQKNTCKTQTSSFQLEDLCRANELCSSLSECVSQPDCIAFCHAEVSPKKKNHTSSPAKSTSEWLVNKTGTPWSKKEAGQTPMDESLPDSELRTNMGLGHFQDLMKTDKSVWLAKSEENKAQEMDTAVQSPSSAYKDNKEEANIWLRGSNVPQGIHESQSLPSLHSMESMFSRFSTSDWLVGSPENHVGKKNVECDHDMEKEESDGWSICSTPHSLSSEQYAKDVEVASSYINNWVI